MIENLEIFTQRRSKCINCKIGSPMMEKQSSQELNENDIRFVIIPKNRKT